MTETKELYENIIKNNYCIGCGACASVRDSPFRMQMDVYGNIIAYPHQNLDNNNVKVLNICPFSNDSRNESEISEILFSEINNNDTKIGKYLECFAGYVKIGDFRKKGSSGGIAKWLGYALLNENKVDYFVHVVANHTNDPQKPLFDYAVISDKNDVINGSKSSYYPVTLVNIVKTIRETDGRYAITGVPCFIKALRLLAFEEDIFKKRIKYTIGIVCGGMKSANHSKLIGWQLGVKPENLVSIDFRRKHIDKPASYKIYQVWSNLDTNERYKDSYELYGIDWGAGYFKPNACDYCDDVVGETADVSLGDAWLPRFEADPDGTTIIIVRNKEILDVINRNNNETLVLTDLTATDVAKSQDGGFRHRREALSLRIAKKEINNNWYPNKRVIGNEYKLTKKRKTIYSLREEIAKQSHISFLNALSKNDITVFNKEMNPLIKKYFIANNGSLPIRGFRKIKRIIYRVFSH